MRILGIDYGKKRIGTAVSDETLTIAGPLIVVDNRKSLKAQFAPLIEEYSVNKIILGLPLEYDGNPGPLAPRVEKLAELLQNWFGVETMLWDERYTSIQADAVARKSGTAEQKGNRDMVAATIILQSFLDSEKNTID